MDMNKLVGIFKGTIDPSQRESAEQQLDQIYKIIGFAPALLELVVNQNVEMPVRQAAAIYLKNTIVAHWADKEPPASPTGVGGHNPAALSNMVRGLPSCTLEFSIHEQDRARVREMIIDAIVHSPEMLAVHLAGCIHHIIKHDFPGRWTGIIDKSVAYLQSPDRTTWFGTLMAIYQLVKFFEYKSGDDRKPLDSSMELLLPLLYHRLAESVRDESELSVLLQKQTLKIFYAFVQYHFSVKLLNQETFHRWMECFLHIVERPVPNSVNDLDIDSRADNIHWKAKKWALHILTRTFDRYGSPGNVQKEYKDFATWYVKTFSKGIIGSLLKILDLQAHKVFVAPRVVQQTLNYFNTAVNYSQTWKMIKTHMPLMIQQIIFPLMCYTEEDHELWTSDPQAYIRCKFDVFEDYVSPVTAAQTLLHSCCKKRKEMLAKTLSFIVEVMNNHGSDPRMKDGALHMVGSVADILLKKQTYKEQMESMLANYVFPYFTCQFGYLRARACWVLHYFAETRFQNDAYLFQALNYAQNCLLNDDQLPVKVEAAICYQELIGSQEKLQKPAEDSVRQAALEMLKITRETENEDLTNVLQKLICMFPEQLVPIACEMTSSLAMTFNQIMDSTVEDENEDKALTAMGILNTIDTILTMMDDQIEVMKQLEPIVIKLIEDIFNKEQMDLYEEALTLLCTISTNYVSAEQWKVFELMYSVFSKDGFDYFTDMMPALHNFITVDPNAFLSNPNHLIAVYNMCKTVMNADSCEDAECHAAKLMECLILQFPPGTIDSCIHPLVELALARLTREVKTAELRTMCLQVVIAALYYNPELLFGILDKMQPNSNQSIFAHFLKQWMNDAQCFMGLHDRKLCLLGLITLMTLPAAKRPRVVADISTEIVPTALKIFEGLKYAYQSKANADNQESSDSEAEEEEDVNDFEEDEDLDDDDDHSSSRMLRGLVRKANNAGAPFPMTGRILSADDVEDIDEDDEEDVDETDDEEDEFEQTALESYTTPMDDEDSAVDEYVAFKEVLETLQHMDADWYAALMSKVNNPQQKAIRDVFTLAVQRKAAAESRKIEKSGGYMFTNQAVPSSFNFGGTPIS